MSYNHPRKRPIKGKKGSVKSKIDTGLGRMRKTRSNKTTAKKKLGTSSTHVDDRVIQVEIDFTEIEKLDAEYAEEISDFVRVSASILRRLKYKF